MLPYRYRSCRLASTSLTVFLIGVALCRPVSAIWCFSCDTHVDKKCIEPIRSFSTSPAKLIEGAAAQTDSNKVFAFSASSYIGTTAGKLGAQLADLGKRDDFCTPTGSSCRYDAGPLRLVDCDVLLADKLTQGRKSMCQKITQYVTMVNKGEYASIVRMCVVKPVNYTITDKWDDCPRQTSNDGSVKVWHCSCESDACNQAGSFGVSLFAIAYALLFAAAVFV